MLVIKLRAHRGPNSHANGGVGITGRLCVARRARRPLLARRVIRVYSYEKCGTCRKALKFLSARGVTAEVIPIREQPPTKAELQRMLALAGGLRKLFNTSGLDYKKLNLKARLPTLSESQAIELLSKNGNLVKRPFLLTSGGGAVGFKEDEWRKLI